MKHLRKSTALYLIAGPPVFGLVYALIAAFSGSQDGMLSDAVSSYDGPLASAFAENTKMFLIFAPFAVIGAYFYTGLIFIAAGAAGALWKKKYGTTPLWLVMATAALMSAASGYCLHSIRWFAVWPGSFNSLLRFVEWSVPLALAAAVAWLVHERQIGKLQ